MKNKTIFIDRDGTINVDVHYIDDPEKFEMYSGVGTGLRRLQENGYKIIVVTNQSGIGRGYFTEKQLSDIHSRMRQEFQKFSVTLDGIYYCPHHPDDRCNCRKPNTELFERAVNEHDVNIKKSFMLGDKILDICAGEKMGLRTVLIPEPQERSEILSKKQEWDCKPDFLADNFLDAVAWILKIE
jgi:D,D-heptose 1,7-bisphosphate phosphatase